MDYEVIKINSNSWRIENGGVRFFLLTGTEKALLIDSGMTTQNAKEIAETITSLPIAYLITHSDRDHICGSDGFDTVLMHPLEEAHFRLTCREEKARYVNEGDIIDLGDRKLEIIHIPGHTPGSIAVLDREARFLISGDPIQENGRIFMFGEHRNMEDYIKSLEHLKKWERAFDEIWPSHANIPISPENIDKLHDGAFSVVSGKVNGKEEELHGHKIVVYDLGFSTLLCDKKYEAEL